MVKVYILDVKELEYDRECGLVSKAQLEKISKCKVEEERLRALGGALLLQYVNALPIIKQPFAGSNVVFEKISVMDLYAFLRKPMELPITIGEFGKPYLEASPWKYNISHSGDYAVLAWGLEEMGVDIQKEKVVDKDAFSKRFFTEDEADALSGEDKERAFYNIWCRKEAYGKLKGVGLKEEILAFSTLEESQEVLFTDYSDLDGYCLSVCTYKKN